MIDTRLAQLILTHMAGCYLGRELDRQWMDEILNTTAIGRRLRSLSPGQIQGIEFVMYAISGYIVSLDANPSLLRQALQELLINVQPNLFAKLLRGQSQRPMDIRAILDQMSDGDVQALYREIAMRLKPSANHSFNDAQGPRQSGSPERELEERALHNAADAVNSWRQRFRQRHLKKL